MDLKQNYQVLTSFPNQNEKHIDYVFVCKKLDDLNDSSRFKKKCLENRKFFFDYLEKDSFEIYNIDANNDKKEIFTLLHCKTDRLLKEAEYINLKMKIKSVILIFFFFTKIN